jgi:L-threonine kinase
VQGTLDGVPCLVSCAIDWHAEATVTLNGAGGWRFPGTAPKAAAALRLALAARDLPAAVGALRLDNSLPRGRGYASSTADVAGAIYAAGAALGRPFTAGEAARLAVQVEPSDSTIFPGPTLFAHRDGSFHRPLAPLPLLAVVILDPGGAVDTLAFNAADHTAALRRLAPIHREAFGRFEAGLAAGDPVEAAQAATLSAIAHQAILLSALVEAARAAYADLGALGVCRAHSGTLVGLVCRPEEAAEVARRAAARFPGVIVRPRRCVG